ncbi:restriction endonuclease [Pantoea agglomerans]|jgi:hypothetical protein|uniref:NgoMIV family type II restriction endonuclease n=1 Tax=Enterobacter agglomerans TaxID=549 RepID=UPI001780E8FA|nr:NgoMIV family type II restriction endonuclease [Pantoea agglomerans]MBD8199129.1 restriction endonuclease [Pantoea agglomerans]
MKGLITFKRDEFHRQLIMDGTWSFSRFNKFNTDRIASNADMGQKTSVMLSNNLLDKISQRLTIPIIIHEKKKDGQTVGHEFENACATFIRETFPKLNMLRPGKWDVQKVLQRNNGVLGQYEQYAHLTELAKLAHEHDTLKNFLGDGYTIAPDIIISREPEDDLVINNSGTIVDSFSSKHTMIRLENHTTHEPKKLLHASISCKFTMRSDRSQNTRTEALNLIRTRKGRTPHIIAVTAEPTASRLSSLALGTGDMDYVYHFALYELIECYQELGDSGEEGLSLLMTMIEGKRLRDISDLPLDLAI